MLFVMLQSNLSGPIVGSGSNCTGSKGSVTNCGGSGCHGGAGATTAVITVDSAGGVPVTQYVPGMSYTVTVTGALAGKTKYGFQFVSASGVAPSHMQAGTFSSLPTKVASHPSMGLNFIEHNNSIDAPLSKSFTWTAPASGVGDITMFLTVNATDGNGAADAADLSGNTSITLTEHTTSGVANVSNSNVISTYPNPVSNVLNIAVPNPYTGYAITVRDMNGRSIYSSVVAANATATSTINTSNWSSGTYVVAVESVLGTTTAKVVKM